MNNKDSPDFDEHRTLQILSELSDNSSVTQRDLSSKLGIALGLVNSYIKNLVKKGLVKIKSIPPRRYTYYITPKGFAEKTQLTYRLLHNYTNIYRHARGTLKNLFSKLEAEGVKRVVFAGADEIAEIAYITLHETNLQLAGVVDDEKAGEKFFTNEVKPVREINVLDHDSVIVTSYKSRKNIYETLLKNNVDKKDIKMIFEM